MKKYIIILYNKYKKSVLSSSTLALVIIYYFNHSHFVFINFYNNYISIILSIVILILLLKLMYIPFFDVFRLIDSYFLRLYNTYKSAKYIKNRQKVLKTIEKESKSISFKSSFEDPRTHSNWDHLFKFDQKEWNNKYLKVYFWYKRVKFGKEKVSLTKAREEYLKALIDFNKINDKIFNLLKKIK